jgi:hypothetical protein
VQLFPSAGDLTVPVTYHAANSWGCSDMPVCLVCMASLHVRLPTLISNQPQGLRCHASVRSGHGPACLCIAVGCHGGAAGNAAYGLRLGVCLECKQPGGAEAGDRVQGACRANMHTGCCHQWLQPWAAPAQNTPALSPAPQSAAERLSTLLSPEERSWAAILGWKGTRIYRPALA